jgi:membrane protease YdiL (CAAX protease family)
VLLRAFINAAVVLGVSAPFIVASLWRTRARKMLAISTVFVSAGLILLDEIVLRAPRVGAFSRTEWNWEGKGLEVCLSVLAIVILRMSAEEAAVGRPRPRWIWPSFIAAAIIFVLPIVFFFVQRTGETLTLEGWAFQLTMPGLAEELLFRGVIQGVLNRGMGKQWQIAGTPIGWGWLITSVLFSADHIISVSRQMHVSFDLAAGIGPLIGSLIGGWLRERVRSVWPVAVIHNISNVLIPALTLLRR